MVISKRLAAVFASGLLLGAAAVAGARKTQGPASSPVPDEPKPSVPPLRRVSDEAEESTSADPPPQPVPDPSQPRVAPPQPALPSRQLAIFASALVLIALAVVGRWLMLAADSSSVARQPKTSLAASQPAASALGQLAACPLQPAAAAAGGKDGQFPLQANVSGLIAADIASFVVVGKEAAATGRPRDAEVAFVMACRVADKLRGSNSVESADARYELASHYAALALLDGSVASANRAELLGRAELLYSDSLQVYLLKYGQAHEKSRFATEGLASVRQTLAPAQTAQQSAPVPEKPAQQNAASTIEAARAAAPGASKPNLAAEPRPRPRKVELAKAALAAPQKPSAATRSKPSFNCTRARSVSEKMICSDAELARLDRELGALYARAKNAASDRAAFGRQQDQERRMRETLCRDRDCLLRWYAQRRNQLIAVIERRGQSQQSASSRWGKFPLENLDIYRGGK